MAPTTPQYTRFQLDLVRYRLLDGDAPVHLERQPMELLILLVQRRGELVSREEIAAQLWSNGVFVDADQSINRVMRKLRMALHDDPDHPKFVETVVGKGYRFTGDIRINGLASERCQDVSRTADDPSVAASLGERHRRIRRIVLWAVLLVCSAGLTAAWSWSRHRTVRPASRFRSIAVLPLENLSGDQNQDYFADGMTDELITDLAKISSLRVISRTSSMYYKNANKPLSQIAKELDVDAVVEGSVIRSADRVRVTAQLIDAQSDHHLWAENYDSEISDVLTLQNQIAAAIANEIEARLTPDERLQLSRARPISPAAYEAYLRGRFHFNKRNETDLRTGIDYFNQAVAADPQYALAYVGLADSYNILGSWVFTAVPRDEARSKALMFADKALAIDATLGEAHTSRADTQLLFDFDWKGSEVEFKRALALSPNYANAHNWYAELLVDSGRFDESLRETYKARELDPLSPMMNISLASRLCLAHRCKDAMPVALAALEIDPNFALGHVALAVIYGDQGKSGEVITELRRAMELSGHNPNFVAWLAYAYAVTGDRSRTHALLNQLKQTSRDRYVAPYQLAKIYCGLGDKHRALQALERAYRERSPYLDNLYLDSSPGGPLAILRTETEFTHMLEAIGPSAAMH